MGKVLVFGITDNPGGVESVIMNYYRNIDKTQIKFDFLCNTDIVAYEDEINKLGGKIYRITARSKNRKQYKKDMTKFFKEHASEYNAIWVNVCSLANIDYLKYAKKYGIEKRIIHSHNSQNMDSFLRGVLHRFNKLFIKKYATNFWTCSNEAAKWFYNKRIINGSNYLLVNNAIDLDKYKFNQEVRDEYRKKFNLKDSTLIIGNVGRLHFQKNQSFLLDIANELKNQMDDFQVWLVGQGEDEEMLKNKVKEYDIDRYVKFLGVRDDVEKLMQAMDMFVFPSIFEGLGLALIEAQASGLMCLSTKDKVPELVKMSENFEFIELNNNAKEWANKIYERRIYKRDSKITIKENGYDIKTEVKKIEDFFGKGAIC